jgi:hypothetical protein
MPRRSDIFTPAAVRMIRRLAEQGQSAAEIAEAIGSTPGSVRVKCCRLKISCAAHAAVRQNANTVSFEGKS